MMKQAFELLAPAGSYEILKAVIEAGADAVYVGGSKFGARAYANNFTEEELLSAIDYVHLRNKKLFLTVNTLFKNDELGEELYEYIRPYYERGLDAVIVQDMGVIAFLKKHFPNLPIHTSTQMTITGAEGAKLLKNLGAERVVLARELSIEEMAKIQNEAQVQLEAFVHGALCYSYSGQCLFSSVLGGRSGNRGRCAQPCRLSYTVLDADQKELKKESYVLSLKDLCGIQYLKQLQEAGVYSLKIEGRMKQASYAAGVVSYYRKYIDLAGQVSDADMKHIYELGNRCGFTAEYFKQQNDKSMVTFSKPSYEKSNEELHQKIEKMYLEKKIQLPISGTLSIKKHEPLMLFVRLNRDITICAAVTGQEVTEARNKPLEYADVRSRMEKTGESPFVFTDLEIDMDSDIFVPNGVLNQLRRDALDNLKQAMLEPYFVGREQNEPYTSNDKNLKEDLNAKKEAQNTGDIEYIACCENMAHVDKSIESEKISTIYIDCQMFTKKEFVLQLQACVEKIKKAHKSVFLRLPAIFRAKSAKFYADIMEDMKKVPLDGFVIRNYEQIHFLSTYCPQSVLVADYNLYTYNDYAKAEFESLGVKYTTVALELNQREIRGRNNVNSEMLIYGHYPLMISAGCVHKNVSGCDKIAGINYLKDRYQVLFPVKNNCNDCYNIIYNSLPTVLFGEIDKLKKNGICRFRLDFTVESATQTEQVLTLLEGKGKEIEHTKGHYKRGVE